MSWVVRRHRARTTKMETAFAVIGWLIGLLMLPHFVAVAFARHVGVVLALNRVHPSALDAIDKEADGWSKRMGAAFIPYWIVIGCYWLFHWPALRWVMLAYAVILILTWFSGLRAIKRKVGL